MKNTFVYKGIAIKLKQAGFNEPCAARCSTIVKKHIVIDLENLYLNSMGGSLVVSLPTYDQVFQWFYEKKLEIRRTEKGFSCFDIGVNGYKRLFSKDTKSLIIKEALKYI